MTLRPRALELLTVAALAAALPAAHAMDPREAAAGPGISYALPIAPQWQARLGLSGHAGSPHTEGGSASRSLSLFGDYYIPRAFGLRATGGIVLGGGSERPGATLWPALGSRLSLHPGGVAGSWQEEHAALDAELASGATPYFGLGYTGLAARGSLGFFADLGLRGLTPRPSVQLGGASGASWRQAPTPEIWRPWREWRFEPVLQLGVSYAF